MVLIRRIFTCVLLVTFAISGRGQILTSSDTTQLRVSDFDNYIQYSLGNLFDPEVIDGGFAVLLNSLREALDGIDDVYDEEVVFVRPSDRDLALAKFGSVQSAVDKIEQGDYLQSLCQLRELIRDIEDERAEDDEYLHIIGADIQEDDVLVWTAQILIIYCDWKLCRQYQAEALAGDNTDTAFVAVQYLMRFFGDLLHAFDTKTMNNIVVTLSEYFEDPDEAQKVGVFLRAAQLYYLDWQINYYTVAHQATYKVNVMMPPYILRLQRSLCQRWSQADELYPYPEYGQGDLGWLIAQHELIRYELASNNFNHAYLCAKSLREEIRTKYAKHYNTQPFTIYQGCMNVLIGQSTDEYKQAYTEEFIDYLLRTNASPINILPFLRIYYGCRYEKEYTENSDYRWIPLSDASLIEDASIIREPTQEMTIDRYREWEREQLKDLIVYLSYIMSNEVVRLCIENGVSSLSDEYVRFVTNSLLWGMCSVLYSLYFDSLGLSPDIIPDSPEHVQAMYIAHHIEEALDTTGFSSNFTDFYSVLSAYCEGDYENAYNMCNKSVGNYGNVKIACNNIYICLRCAEYLGKTAAIGPLVEEYKSHLAPILYKELPTGAEIDMENYWILYEKISRQINHLLLSGDITDMRPTDVFDNILAIKGFLTDQRMKLDLIVERSGSESLLEDYASMRQMQAEALEDPERSLLSTDQYRSVESSVMAKVRDVYGQLMSSTTTTAELRSALADGECAIEFYDAADVEGRGYDVEGSDLYALVIRYDDDEVRAIRLGECPPAYHKTDEAELRRLYQTFWEPLRPMLEGMERVYFSLDRSLDSLPVEYALNNDGVIAGEEFGCYRLSSTRQICQRPVSYASDMAAVLYGGLDFDESDDSVPHTLIDDSCHGAANSRGKRSSQDYLWGSLQEVDDISMQMERLGKTYTKYVHTLGTESSFADLDGQHIDVLHLATHGLCFDQEVMSTDYADVHDVRLFDIIRSSKGGRGGDLWRNALAMSGCNKTLTGQSRHADTSDDGILTAAEISGFDLSGIDLVVLSSCHSGYYGGADGYGLQRGFKMAGAHSLIMTLWEVDDDAMQLLMSEFYTRYLGGADKRTALSAAQQTLRSSPEYHNPEYWAGVILVDGQ